MSIPWAVAPRRQLVDEIAETWVNELSPDTALLPWRHETWAKLVAEDVLATGDGGE